MRPKAVALLLIGLVLGGAVLGLFWNVVQSTSAQNAPAPQKPTEERRKIDAPAITFIDQVIGPKDASITIVEFGDYLCPHCRDAEEAVQRLLGEQPSRLRYVWKDMPSPLHPNADTAAEAALCAGRQGAFWSFHRNLFETASAYDQTSLTFLADQAGLDTQTFAECLSSHETKPLVERTVDEGLALGITGLPTFFINGKRFDGALTYDELKEATR